MLASGVLLARWLTKHTLLFLLPVWSKKSGFISQYWLQWNIFLQKKQQKKKHNTQPSFSFFCWNQSSVISCVQHVHLMRPQIEQNHCPDNTPLLTISTQWPRHKTWIRFPEIFCFGSGLKAFVRTIQVQPCDSRTFHYNQQKFHSVILGG